MSKKSCEAAESIEDALLRMARVNCNKYSAQNYTAAESGVVKTRTGIGHFACCRTRPKGALLRLDHNQFFCIQCTLHHFIDAVL